MVQSDCPKNNAAQSRDKADPAESRAARDTSFHLHEVLALEHDGVAKKNFRQKFGQGQSRKVSFTFKATLIRIALLTPPLLQKLFSFET